MKIQVRNIGAIGEATIDLGKKLIIFCGPNNTGKTYLAYVIYALSGNSYPSRMQMDDSKMKQLTENDELVVSIDPQEVFRYRKMSTDYIKDNLDTIFGISDEEAEKLFEGFDINFLTSESDCSNELLISEYKDTITLNKNKFVIVKKTGSYDITIIPNKDNVYGEEAFMISVILPSAIYKVSAFAPIIGTEIFPVERNSIYTFNKELSLSRNALIDQMQKLSRNEKLDPFTLLNYGSKRYPLAIRDGLRVANDLETIKKEKGYYYELASEIEQELLDGKLDVSSEGDVIFYPNKAASKKRGKLPIHMSASIVKTLSSLIFNLKHITSKNELLIIDEPEMNLHPDNQLILARILGKLLNNGLRLLISTHSDYIVREFNNMIMAKSLYNKGISLPDEYIDSTLISNDDVGVHYFDYYKNGRKVVVKNIEVSDKGFNVPSIDDAIEHQNFLTEKLFYATLSNNK